MRIRNGLGTKVVVAVFALAWVSAVGAGLRALQQYTQTPGRLAKPPLQWPAIVPIERSPGHFQLVVFAHPRCPCTRATMGELEWVMTHGNGKLDTTVYFYAPTGAKEQWLQTDMWRSANAIPRVTSFLDPDGQMARQFGASTSGQTLLYDYEGRLVFNGGITHSRGHSGSNNGRDSILALISGGAPRQTRTPVFGCSLLGESEERNR